MAARLTTFSKLLITILILGLIFGLGWYVLNKTSLGDSIKEKTEEYEANEKNNTNETSGVASSSQSLPKANQNGNAGGADENTLKVQLVTWGGYAPGLYFNEGAAATTRSRYYQDYGFKVEFKLENDLINALNSWISGEYDVIVQTVDAFPLYTAPDDINRFNPKAFMQVDWSRGGDALIVKRGINTINDLKGKRIAVAVPSPAQTLLISSLEAAGLSYSDVEVIKTSDNLKAAEAFKANDVDAAVVWSPDDILATQAVPGSKILLTTREQTHIIGDIMLAKEEVIKAKQKMFDGFYEGWMKGVAELKNEANLNKAAKYLAELNQLPVEDALGMMSTVYWTNHGDNQNFFGFNNAYRGQKGQDLYEKMSEKFVETGDSEKTAPSWRSVINTSAVRNAKLTGAIHQPEGAKEFKPTTAKEKSLPAFATKPVSISFATGQSSLTENAKTIIDYTFADVAKSFAGVKIRVEGNTDRTGSRANNIKLSEKRAQAVSSYLQSQYGMPANRFVVVGNGPDKPVPECATSNTDACNAKNRRTEFQLIAGE